MDGRAESVYAENQQPTSCTGPLLKPFRRAAERPIPPKKIEG